MHFFSNTQLDSMREQLETILKTFDNARAIRESINDHKGLNDTVARKNDSMTNPESYYKFQVFDKGVAIVWSAFTWNEQLQKMSRAKTWKYSICCYGFTPIENKELMRRVNYTNNCFGEYDSIEQALPRFLECVAFLVNIYSVGIDNNNKDGGNLAYTKSPNSLKYKELSEKIRMHLSTFLSFNDKKMWITSRKMWKSAEKMWKSCKSKILYICRAKGEKDYDKLYSTDNNSEQKQGITFSELYYRALWEMLKL